MRLRLTHLVRYSLDGGDAPARDAVAAAEAPPGGRWFVPGMLACGDCPLCRRGLVSVCPNRKPALPEDPVSPASGVMLELPDRFLTSLDDPPGLPELASATALVAGPVALALHALAMASASPGDLAVWLGEGPIARLGARVSAARGLKAHLLVQGDGPASQVEGVEVSRSFDTLDAALAAAAAPEPAVPPEPTPTRPSSAGHAAARGQRHLFLASAAMLPMAAARASVGGTITVLGPGPLRLPAGLELPPEVRLLRIAGYHPDFVPEALALLRREPALADELPTA